MERCPKCWNESLPVWIGSPTICGRTARFREPSEDSDERYLAHEGSSLIHGDLFPGSLLQTGSGELRVIDPEFCFCGDPEFDIGVFYAHLLLSEHGEEALSGWLQAALQNEKRSDSLVFQFAGCGNHAPHSRGGPTASSPLIGGEAPLAGTKPCDGSSRRQGESLSCILLLDLGREL